MNEKFMSDMILTISAKTVLIFTTFFYMIPDTQWMSGLNISIDILIWNMKNSDDKIF